MIAAVLHSLLIEITGFCAVYLKKEKKPWINLQIRCKKQSPLTWNNPALHSPDSPPTTILIIRLPSFPLHPSLQLCASSPPPPLFSSTSYPPWVILTWWIIKTSEALAPSGHRGLAVQGEERRREGGVIPCSTPPEGKRYGLDYEQLLSIHPHSHAHFHRPGNNSPGPRSQHGCHVFSWNTCHSGAVVAARFRTYKGL